jgi:hypothetical protein
MMIVNDRQLEATLERIACFQKQVAHLRKTEANPVNYRAAVSGFLAEIDRMQLEVCEYFSVLPAGRAAHSRKLSDILDAANRRIEEGAGIGHDEFWRQVESASRTRQAGPG